MEGRKYERKPWKEEEGVRCIADLNQNGENQQYNSFQDKVDKDVSNTRSVKLKHIWAGSEWVWFWFQSLTIRIALSMQDNQCIFTKQCNTE